LINETNKLAAVTNRIALRILLLLLCPSNPRWLRVLDDGLPLDAHAVF
jgi:hypothetical protein